MASKGRGLRRGERNMGSMLAAAAIGALMTGAGSSHSPARAAISPQERSGAIQTYRIPAGSMASALNVIADENDLHVLYDAHLTDGLRTSGLTGAYSLRDALGALLTGTGLRYEFSRDGHAVSIVLAQAETGVRNDAAAEALPTIDVGAEQPRRNEATRGAGRAGDPKSYVAPVAASGTKTDTPVMETPLNVQTITQQVLQDRQVTTIDEALKNISGVTIQPSGGTGGSSTSSGSGSIVIRGFQTSSIFRNGFRNTTDLASIGIASGFDLEFANIDRVEVMKGAPAILYGTTEPGGLVNYITKRPQETPYYSVQQQIQSYAFYRTSIDATGPVTKDKSVLYRVNMSYENSGSFVDFVHASKFFISPVVTWNITPRTQANLEFEYLKAEEGQYTGMIPSYNGRLLSVPRSRNYGEASPMKVDRYLVGFDWAHEINDNWKFAHRVQYVRSDLNSKYAVPYYFEDIGSTALVHIYNGPEHQGIDSFSTEANLTGRFYTGELEHTLLFGGDFYRTNSWRMAGLAADSVIDALNPMHPSMSIDPLFFLRVNYLATTYNYGLYVQDQIKLPFGLHLMGGVRYQNISQLSSSAVYQPYGTGAFTGPDTLRTQRVTPRVGVLWQARDWLSFYGNYAEGFGPNVGTIFPNKPVPPSDARQYEFGAKTEFFGGRLRATAAYFNLAKTNAPTSDPQHIGFNIVTGEVNAKGVELDLQGEVLPAWNVILTYANTETLITRSNNNDLGQRFYNVPRNTASFWNTYEFRQGALEGLRIGGGVTYRDAQRIYDYTGLNLRKSLAPYATVDLMSAYSFYVAGTKLTAQINISNLLDHTYFTAGGTGFATPTGSGWDGEFRSVGAPRTFKGSLRAEF